MKKFILAVAVAAVAITAVAASVASAGGPPARYQLQSMTITAIQPKDQITQWTDIWTHAYNVTLNPCDGSFTGTGTLNGTPSQWDSRGFWGTETITGTLNGDGTISFTGTRSSTDGVAYSLNHAPLDNSTVTLATTNPVFDWPLEFKVSAGTPTNTTDYKNHGDFVSSQADKNDAAHSCIGMPIH